MNCERRGYFTQRLEENRPEITNAIGIPMQNKIFVLSKYDTLPGLTG
jgi:hypothetical protein